MREDIKKHLEDWALVTRLTGEMFNEIAGLPADFDFEARQKGRLITEDDIINLRILLNSTEDVNDFVNAI